MKRLALLCLLFGLATLPAAVVTTLIAPGSTWKYLDDGSDQGAGWRAPAFNDSTWASDPGPLGYFDPHIVTAVNGGPLTNFVTTYFRRAFDVSVASSVTGLAFRVLRDDGTVAFLNGAEIFRMNMPATNVSSTTYAASIIGGTNEAFYFPTNLIPPPGLLRNGRNVIAVELHQRTPPNPDAGFDLALAALHPPCLAESVPPVLTGIFPPPGRGLLGLDYVIVAFSEPVAGLQACDLRLNGGCATCFAPAAGNRYLLRAPTLNTGLVNVAWAANHGITDQACGSNAFAGGSWSYTLFAESNLPPLRVTEIMYNPAPPPPGVTTSPQDFEFIEVKNISPAATLNLNNVRFTDGINFNFSGSAVTNLAPGARVLVVKNRAAFASRYPSVTNNVAGEFTGSLDNGGERLALTGAGGEPILEFSYDNAWFPMTDGAGPSLVAVDEAAPRAAWSLRGAWRPSTATNGSPGALDPPPPSLPPVVVNEVLTHTDPPLEDAIELFNPAPDAADLSGWFLTDDLSEPRKFQLPPGTIIPAGGYKVFYENQFNTGRPGSFALSADGEEVFLFSGGTNGTLTGYAHGFRFGAAENGVSFARYVNSAGEEDFLPASARTFGMDAPATVAQFRTGLGASNAPPRVGPVVISEVMYHPMDLGTNDNTLGEFIELHNISGAPVALFDPVHPTNTWRLARAVDFAFPTNVTLAAGGLLLVVGFDPANGASLAAFRAAYDVPAGARYYGPWSRPLDNSAASVELRQPGPPNPTNFFVPYTLASVLRYRDAAPWPLLADGGGKSLQLPNDGGTGTNPDAQAANDASPGRTNMTVVIRPPIITAPPTDIPITGPTFTVEATGGYLTFIWFFNGMEVFREGPMMNPGTTTSSYTVEHPLCDLEHYSVNVFNACGCDESEGVSVQFQLPTIQVTNADACRGRRVEFQVPQGFLSIPSLTFQWQHNGTDVPGATGVAYTKSAVQVADAGAYSVVIHDGDDCVVTNLLATLNVRAGPTITSQSGSQIVVIGAMATFSVTANGTPPLTYQWQFNGGPISGATSSMLNIPNAQAPNIGAYTVLVASEGCSVTSSNATLTVRSPLAIVQAPTNVAVCAGTPAVFSVMATSTNGPLRYQWQTNGVPILNATNSSYTNLSVATCPPVTNLRVVVSDNFTNLTSGTATLTVHTPLIIMNQPQTNAVCLGGANTFSVLASNGAPLSFQWRLNGTNLPGGMDSTLTVANAQMSNAGTYSVMLSNVCGNLVSNMGVLIVRTPPLVTAGPSSLDVCAGEAAMFTVAASNGSAAPLTYQWRFNGSNIAGAISNIFVRTSVSITHTGAYSVVVANDCGSVTSAVATLTLLPALADLSVSLTNTANGVLLLVVSNAGPCTATNVIVTNFLPRGLAPSLPLPANLAFVDSLTSSISFGPLLAFIVTNASAPYAVAVADLDGDGWKDVIVIESGTDGAGAFYVLRNSGRARPFDAAALEPARAFAPGLFAHGIAVTDFNGDGKPDVAFSAPYGAGTAESRVAYVFPNASTSGAVSFGSSLVLRGVGGGGEAIRAADLNRDGKPDLVVGGLGLSVFENRFTGSVPAFGPGVLLPASVRFNSLVAEDLDDDGWLDLLAGYGQDNFVSIFRSRLAKPGALSTEAFDLRLNLPIPCSALPGIAAVDLDGDGLKDVIVPTIGNLVGCPQPPGIALSYYTILRQRPTTNGLTTNSFPSREFFGYGDPGAPVSGDLNGDGLPDFAAIEKRGGHFNIFRGTNEPSGFTLASFGGADFATGLGSAREPVLGDLDGDGLPEVVFTHRTPRVVSLLPNTSKHQLRWTLATLAADAATNFTVSLTQTLACVPDPIAAAVSSDLPDSNPTNNTARLLLQLPPSAMTNLPVRIRAETNQIEISWTNGFSGYCVEWSPMLSSPASNTVWTPLLAPVVVIPGRGEGVRLPHRGPARFFRLRSP